MPMQLLEGLTPQWYIPEADETNDEAKEGFEINPLNGPDYLYVITQVEIDSQKISSDGLVFACRKGLIGWRNIVNGKGEVVAYAPSRVNEIPGEWLALIGAEVIRISGMDRDKAGN